MIKPQSLNKQGSYGFCGTHGKIEKVRKVHAPKQLKFEMYESVDEGKCFPFDLNWELKNDWELAGLRGRAFLGEVTAHPGPWGRKEPSCLCKTKRWLVC